jgi:hypothetical protein
LNKHSYTLREYLSTLVWPGRHRNDGTPWPLFFSIDYPSSGEDKDNGVVYFAAYRDIAPYAEGIVAILPALVHKFVGEEAVSRWFHQNALEYVGQVTFHFDLEGNWTGYWKTQEDDLLDDTLDEDMGVAVDSWKVDMNGLDAGIGNGLGVFYEEDQSVVTYGTELGARAPPTNQQTGSDTLADQAAGTMSGRGDAV